MLGKNKRNLENELPGVRVSPRNVFHTGGVRPLDSFLREGRPSDDAGFFLGGRGRPDDAGFFVARGPPP